MTVYYVRYRDMNLKFVKHILVNRSMDSNSPYLSVLKFDT